MELIGRMRQRNFTVMVILFRVFRAFRLLATRMRCTEQSKQNCTVREVLLRQARPRLHRFRMRTVLPQALKSAARSSATWNR